MENVTEVATRLTTSSTFSEITAAIFNEPYSSDIVMRKDQFLHVLVDGYKQGKLFAFRRCGAVAGLVAVAAGVAYHYYTKTKKAKR